MAGVLDKLFGRGPERELSRLSPPPVDQENATVQYRRSDSAPRTLILARTMLAEMVGTFILVFCACGVISCSYASRGELGLTEYALTGGASLVLLSIIVGPISGAHVNPSITLAFAALGRFPWSKVPFYVAAQFLGSTMAAFLGKTVYKTPAELAATRPVTGTAAAFWAELFATMFIMLICSALSFHAKALQQAAPFAIGAAITLAVFITGPVSGGSMNPARSLGPAIVAKSYHSLWVYFVGPTVGALSGALLYKLMQPGPTSGQRGQGLSTSSTSSTSSPSVPPAREI
ncbi:NOD26-like intrinsic protein 7;1 [Wolffia australiana]